jgi:hypothetical protein
MSTVLSTSDLRAMKRTAIKHAVVKCLGEAPSYSRTARVRELKEEIKAFERDYGMSTKHIVGQVCSSKIAGVGEIETWLTKYNLLSGHEEA